LKTVLKFCFVFSLLLFFQCKKDEPQVVKQHPVPSVPVNLTIYPNDPLNFDIQAIGGWMYFSGGVNGIVLYRKSEQEFVALERTSTKNPSDPKSRAIVLSDNFTMHDTISDSKWRILDGAVTQGPAEWPLRTYKTSYDGNLLKVIN
jgi:hypothetical protein